MANADRIIEVLHEAKARPAGAERALFLAEACGDDQALMEQIVSLLKAEAEDPDYLNNGLLLRPAVAPTENPGDRIGRYKLLEQIGEGGCGVVYMAEQEEPVRRRVALKVIKLGMDTKQVIARFEAERQALAMMDHPNIAKVLDGGATEAGRPYFVMELVRGIKITEYCDQNNLPTADRLKLFGVVCHAIQHAHQKGIIHRDIKPSNILVTQHDDVAVPKVIDFGIAKATTGQLTDKTLFTAFAQFVGTPAYMSPEQAQMSGLDIDTRADIYSLGVLLYELLTGNTPFDAKELLAAGLDEMRRRIREDEPAKPSTCLSTMRAMALTTVASRRHAAPPRLIHLLRGDLDWVVMKCLEKDRSRRYETANALATDLQRHLNNEPVMACPPSQSYRFQKLVRRNKLVFVAGGAITAALVLGLGLSTWSFVNERAARERAVAAEMEQKRLAEKEEAQRKISDQLREKAERDELHARKIAYDSDMLLVEQAIKDQNLGHARTVLEQYVPQPGQPDLRRWEWRYFASQCRNEALFTFNNEKKNILKLVFSPDGQRVFTAFLNDDLKVWDLPSRKLERTLPFPFRGESPCSTLLISPKTHRMLLGGGGEGADDLVRLTDLGAQQTSVQVRVGSRVFSAAISADERSLITLSQRPGAPKGQNRLTIWDAASGKKLKTFEGEEAPHGDAGVLACSPAERLLIVGDAAGVLRWINLDTFSVIRTATRRGRIAYLAFSLDGKVLASVTGTSGSMARSIALWDTSTGENVGSLEGHASQVCSLAFAPDGTLASGSNDQTIKLWNIQTRSEIVTLQGHTRPVTALAFSPDGRLLASGAEDGTISIWPASPKPRLRQPLVLPDKIRSVAFMPGMKSFLTLDAKRSISSWDLRTLALEEELSALGAQSASIDISPDSKWLAAGQQGGRILVWDLAQRRLVTTLAEPSGQVSQVQFFKRRPLLAALHTRPKHRVVIWDTETWQQKHAYEMDDPQSFSISPDETSIAIQSGGEAMVWNFGANGKAKAWRCSDRGIRSIAFADGGKRIAVASGTGIGTVWESETGRLAGTLSGHLPEVISLAVTPDTERVVTGDLQGALRLWDAETLREVCTLNGANGSQVQTSPDGNILVAINASPTGKAYFWRAPTLAELRMQPILEPGEVQRPAPVASEPSTTSEPARPAGQ